MRKLTIKGFTLAELILALAIFAFALAGLLSVFINCIFLNSSNSNLTIATGHAQYALEAVKNTNFASIQNESWNTTVISSKGITPLNSEAINISVTGTSLLDVTATVSWKDRGTRNRSFALQTLIAEP